MFETFAHTADVGIRIRTPNLDELYADAGRGLFAVILADIGTVQPRLERTLRVDGTDRAYLLLDWLNELLFLFESQRLLLVDYDVRVDAQGLQATARGEPLDETRHSLAHEVKAITYHGLFVEQDRGEWTAEVILDI
jgi:SHS2 domain-containing protein